MSVIILRLFLVDLISVFQRADPSQAARADIREGRVCVLLAQKVRVESVYVCL